MSFISFTTFVNAHRELTHRYLRRLGHDLCRRRARGQPGQLQVCPSLPLSLQALTLTRNLSLGSSRWPTSGSRPRPLWVPVEACSTKTTRTTTRTTTMATAKTTSSRAERESRRDQQTRRWLRSERTHVSRSGPSSVLSLSCCRGLFQCNLMQNRSCPSSSVWKESFAPSRTLQGTKDRRSKLGEYSNEGQGDGPRREREQRTCGRATTFEARAESVKRSGT